MVKWMFNNYYIQDNEFVFWIFLILMILIILATILMVKRGIRKC